MSLFNKSSGLLNKGGPFMPIGRKTKASVALSEDEIHQRRRKLVIGAAETAGLLNGENGRIAGRVRGNLIRSAKERTGIRSDTELLEYALAKVALEDDFGSRVLARRGRVSKDVNLEF
ncbi:MAG: hypothetical protein ABW026_08855 [Microvirga sp.]